MDGIYGRYSIRHSSHNRKWHDRSTHEANVAHLPHHSMDHILYLVANVLVVFSYWKCNRNCVVRTADVLGFDTNFILWLITSLFFFKDSELKLANRTNNIGDAGATALKILATSGVVASCVPSVSQIVIAC